jgi:putative ABC transport system permease protein
MTKPYAENKDQLPNDLAILDLTALLDSLKSNYPEINWAPRIKFGGFLDVANDAGETKNQGPGLGLAVSLFDKSAKEKSRLGLKKSLQRGRLPEKSREILLSDQFAKKLKLNPGEKVTYFGSSMEGSMVFESFIMVGTVNFGVSLMDKGTFIIDFYDAQKLLDMQDGAGELLGFFENAIYNDIKASEITTNFNKEFDESSDEFAPIMFTLKGQNDLGASLDLASSFMGAFVFIFIFAMSLVLWNTGLIGGLRRYKEFGIRLALGESKKTVYTLLMLESIIIGAIGSILGTILGVLFCYYLQEVGIDISQDTKNASIVMPSIIRAHVTPSLLYVGFIPGLFSMVFGTALAGRGIFKIKTAQLFKDLEV